MCCFLLNAAPNLLTGAGGMYDIIVIIISEANWQQETRQMFQTELWVHGVNLRLPVYISDDSLLTSTFAKLP